MSESHQFVSVEQQKSSFSFGFRGFTVNIGGCLHRPVSSTTGHILIRPDTLFAWGVRALSGDNVEPNLTRRNRISCLASVSRAFNVKSAPLVRHWQFFRYACFFLFCFCSYSPLPLSCLRQPVCTAVIFVWVPLRLIICTGFLFRSEACCFCDFMKRSLKHIQIQVCRHFRCHNKHKQSFGFPN